MGARPGAQIVLIFMISDFGIGTIAHIIKPCLILELSSQFSFIL